jgi:hypothetical protein
VRNSSLVKCSGADNSTGLKLDTEDVDVQIYLYVVGERSHCFEAVAEAHCGAMRSENAGISNEMRVRISHTDCPRIPE